MLRGVQCVRGRIGLEEHRACMLQPDHPCHKTPDMLEAMTNKDPEREGIFYSPSTLLACQRQSALTKGRDYWVDVDGSGWNQLRGHIAHAYFEDKAPWPGVLGVVREKRFRTEVETKYGVRVFGGKSDLVVLNSQDADGTLHISVVDYKTKREIRHECCGSADSYPVVEADRDNQMQVNLYGWLVARELPGILNSLWALPERSEEWAKLAEDAHLQLNAGVSLSTVTGIVVDTLEIVYFDMKQSRRFTSAAELTAQGKLTKRSYPQEHETLELSPIFTLKHEYVGRWVRKHVEIAIEAEMALPAPLTGNKAAHICGWCPVRDDCIAIGEQEGRSMDEQKSAKVW